MIECRTIKELCSVVVDCPHSTPTWTAEGKNVVRSNNIKNGRIDFSSPSYTDDEHFQQRIKRATPQSGDIIITREAPMGEVGMIPEGIVCCLGQRMVLLRANPEICDNYYLLYSLQSRYVQHQISWSEGTGTTVSNLRIPHLEQLKIPYLPLSKQRQVSSVLRCLEGKIEQNRVINDNLQQQARAIYKEWFIDFGQTSGTTPATWKHGKLKDVLQLHKRAIKAGANTTLPYLPIDTIPMQSFGVTEFRPNDEAKSSLITFQKDDIIVGAMRVYFHRVVLAPCDGITRTTCFTLSPYNSKYLSYALLTCDLDSSIDHAQNTSKGSTMPYAVWDGGMGEIEIVIPPTDVAEEFNNIVLPMLRQIQRNCEEIKLLGSLRDTLLPKLMSGEIDVSGIQL